MYENKIGTIFGVKRLLEEGCDRLVEMGLQTIQLNCGDVTLETEENAQKCLEIVKGKLEITSFWAGWSGPAIWDSVDGPHTLGIVPEAYRANRLLELKAGADFASWLGVKDVATHCGFIPEHPTFEAYRGVVAAIRWIASYCKSKGLHFNFETGQETPVTLMRCITDVGLDNLGINLDPANLIHYGRGNPVDALDLFKGRVRGLHVKDADYSKDFIHLGPERVVGEGTVNFPVFLPKLLHQGYTGDLYIEREISGEQQMIDMAKTVGYIKELMAIAWENR